MNPNTIPIRLELDKIAQDELQMLTQNWYQWAIDQEVELYGKLYTLAEQVAGYQLLVQKQVDKIKTISEKLQTLEDRIELLEDNDPAMEI